MVFTAVTTASSLQPVSKKIQVCLVGLGRAGNFHMQSLLRLSDRANLAWVVDVNEAAVQKAVAIFGCKGTTNLDEALSDPTVDAVIVASTTFMHFEHICKSLNANKAVMTEKPISHNPQEIAHVAQLVRERNLPFLVGFQRRYDVQFAELKHQLQTGVVGAPRIIRSTSRDNPEPSIEYLKISGGIFHDMLCHDFDMLYFITGEIPESVYSVGHCYNDKIREMDDLDTVMVTFKYASGLVASVDTSRISAYGYDQRLEVFGSLGQASVRNVESSAVTVATHTGFQTPPTHYSFPQRYPEAYLAEVRDFISLVHDAKPASEKDLAWMLDLERVTTAAELSWRLGRSVNIADVDSLRQHLKHHN